MIATSQSPTLHSSTHSSPSPAFVNRSHYEGAYRSTLSQPAAPRLRRVPAHSSAASPSPVPQQGRLSTQQSSGRVSSQPIARAEQIHSSSKRMVDASTQYSPPITESTYSTSGLETPLFRVAGLQLEEERHQSSVREGSEVVSKRSDPNVASQMAGLEVHTASSALSATGAKRSTSDLSKVPVSEPRTHHIDNSDGEESPTSKRQRQATPAVKLMPMQYENSNPRDLVVLISSMLMELIRYNDAIPLRDGHLTRFHSRAPPGISVLDYLQRLTTHATLSPPILLSMVYYIDKLCALYPAFTISSLTVHRFLITSATVASKGLSDSFWTNKIYARVGGVTLKELALLELEFLWRVEWRIVPQPEVLVDYYRSLVERTDGYEIDTTGRLEEESETQNRTDKDDKG